MTDKKLHYVGTSKPVHDVRLKVTGQKIYTADMKVQRMLYGKMLFSSIAHGKIVDIDTSEAEAFPGVKAVATFLNSSPVAYNSAQRYYDQELPENEHIFSETVRFVGDRVAAVAAVDLKTAEKAVRLIKVKYKELPALFDPEESLKEGAYQIHSGGNIVIEIRQECGNPEEGFREADFIFNDKYTMPAIHHAAIELHVAIGDYDSSGKLTVTSPNQNTFSFRSILSRIFEMPLNKVRVIRPAIGGAFGGKLEAVLEPVVAQLSIMTGRPVKIELTRAEAITSTRTRHGAVIYLKTGVMKDGTITAQDFKVITNTGAYASSAINVVGAMSHKVFKIYKIPNIGYTGIPVYTNTPIAGAMRGYGSPQAFYAQQVQLRKISAELNIDMVEIQLKNLMNPDSKNLLTGELIGNPRPIDCVKKGASEFGWIHGYVSRGKKENEGRYRHGIGMAAATHGNGLFGAHRDFTCLTLKMNEDGSAILNSGTHDMGNGSIRVQTMIIGEILGIDPDSITCNEADTDLVPYNLGDYASRGTFVSGNAAIKVAEKVKEEILKEASVLLDENVNNLDIEAGYIFTPGKPEKKVGISEVIIHAHKVSQREIIVSETYASTANPSSYGAHFAEVEVDTKTGYIRVLNYVAVHDVGKVINPKGLEGQVEGAIQMGIGYALSEGLIYNEKGKTVNNSFKKYKILRASEMPETKIFFIEEGERQGPYGGKSIGECSTVASAPAVVNAVSNALGGIEIRNFPVRPDDILAILSPGKGDI